MDQKPNQGQQKQGQQQGSQDSQQGSPGQQHQNQGQGTPNSPPQERGRKENVRNRSMDEELNDQEDLPERDSGQSDR